jgi:hypothetical protein
MFHIIKETELAITYNYVCPMENHHAGMYSGLELAHAWRNIF